MISYRAEEWFARLNAGIITVAIVWAGLWVFLSILLNSAILLLTMASALAYLQEYGMGYFPLALVLTGGFLLVLEWIAVRLRRNQASLFIHVLMPYAVTFGLRVFWTLVSIFTVYRLTTSPFFESDPKLGWYWGLALVIFVFNAPVALLHGILLNERIWTAVREKVEEFEYVSYVSK